MIRKELCRQVVPTPAGPVLQSKPPDEQEQHQERSKDAHPSMLRLLLSLPQRNNQHGVTGRPGGQLLRNEAYRGDEGGKCTCTRKRQLPLGLRVVEVRPLRPCL